MGTKSQHEYIFGEKCQKIPNNFFFQKYLIKKFCQKIPNKIFSFPKSNK